MVSAVRRGFQDREGDQTCFGPDPPHDHEGHSRVARAYPTPL